jgi:adenylate cyclase
MTSHAKLHLPDGSTFELTADCSLGRDPDNSVRIDDDLASRHHALVRLQGRKIQIVDLGSSNGTYVNGRRVARPVTLWHDDVIEIGGSRIRFQSGAPAPGGSGEEATAPSVTRSGGVVHCHSWLMLADIEGATEMVHRMPAEEWRRISGEWYKECRTMVEEHGGEIVHHLGDGFLCHWYDGTEAKPRVLAAMRQLAGWQKDSSLPFRIVVHLGKTARTNVPPNGWTFIGPEVHFVFRMEKLAGSWGRKMMCSEAAWERLKVPAFAIEESEVKGYDGRFRFPVPDLRTATGEV